MIAHPQAYVELLLPEQVEQIVEGAMGILGDTGLLIRCPQAQGVLLDHGAILDPVTRRVRMSSGFVLGALRCAPARWTLTARNPARNVCLGGRETAVSPGYGSAFVADARGRRRTATMSDFERFAALAAACPSIDITGGLLVEPQDLPPFERPAKLTRALLRCSDKPFMGSVAGAAGARQSLDMARIALGSLDRVHAVLALINLNSPLRLDDTMAEALIEYVRAGQPVLLTPGIMMGITAPVTVAGALTQAFAELLGGVALIQSLNPGTPVVLGLGGFGADLRSGGPGFGRPENAMATVMGAQIARRLGLPFRCSAAVTGARMPDCRSGYERMMTALGAWTGGAGLCLQAAGILDCINSMSYEQFVIDAEIWAYIGRIARAPGFGAESLARELIASTPGDYMAIDHTVRHMREELLTPTLAPAVPYEDWMADGAREVASLAAERLARGDNVDVALPLSEDVMRELDRYVLQTI